jgi:YbgC/YbaW family acyl-CoA thioester hydrolase
MDKAPEAPNTVFRWPVRIRFIDTDASGRIHYTAMFRYFETAEIEFFRHIGVLYEHPGVSFPRVHVECDYRGAIRHDDLLTIEVSVGRIGRSSVQLKFRATKEEIEAASGNVVIASLDRQTQRATALPENVRAKLLPYLSGGE